MEKIDGRNLSKEEQKILRIRAVLAVIEEGLTQAEAAKIFKVSEAAMNKWLKLYKRGGLEKLEQDRRGGQKNAVCILSTHQKNAIQHYINTKTPDEFGILYLLWTREALQELVKKKYGKHVSIRTVSEWLSKWGYSPQKPAKKAKEQQPKEVQKWFGERYPAIQKRAKEENAEIHWGDESGVQSTDNRQRGYSKKGKTPEIKLSGKRCRCNMISSITNLGKLRFKVFEGKFNADILIDFMRRLIRGAERKIFLILDNHSVHVSKKVRNWLEAHKGEIEVFYLPTYSPELNPDEYLNNHLKKVVFKEKRPEGCTSLKRLMIKALRKIQVNEKLVSSYFRHKAVTYAGAF